jgi:hypothetical protein
MKASAQFARPGTVESMALAVRYVGMGSIHLGGALAMAVLRVLLDQHLDAGPLSQSSATRHSLIRRMMCSTSLIALLGLLMQPRLAQTAALLALDRPVASCTGLL